MTQMYDDALRDLMRSVRGEVSPAGHLGPVSKPDIDRWAETGGMGVEEVFDAIGVGLAKDYDRGILTWGFCDRVANDLFGVLVQTEFSGQCDLFWQFYLAFDCSEMKPTEAESDALAREEIAKFLSSLAAADPNLKSR